MNKVTLAQVFLWGQKVGVVSWIEKSQKAIFQYYEPFLKSGLNISPIYLNINKATPDTIYDFSYLSKNTYQGLPGLLVDSLPDKFGNQLINAWLRKNHRSPEDFNPVEKLCYIGNRGMGALEFVPAYNIDNKTFKIEFNELINGVGTILNQFNQETLALNNDHEQNNTSVFSKILTISTSAGGARPKAVIAMNQEGNILSGQGIVPEGYEHYILKLDGIDNHQLQESNHMGKVEYAYYLMAIDCEIDMMESNLIVENHRAHFISKRFDRVGNTKIHMLTLCGLAHFDFNMVGIHSYESAFQVIRRLKLNKKVEAQFYRRMVFNVIARNHDDHTKNISFLMDQSGQWSLAPAYDLTFSYNPENTLNSHQMSVNGAVKNISLDDLLAVANSQGIKPARKIIAEVIGVVNRWDQYAEKARLNDQLAKGIKSLLLTDLKKS